MLIKLGRNTKEEDLSDTEEDEEWGNADWEDDWEDAEDLEDLEEEW